MTRDKLIEALDDALDELGEAVKCAERDPSRCIKHASEAIAHARMLAEQLDSPPAMTWQDGPSEKGWCWVEKCDGPRFVWYLGEGDWVASPDGEGDDGLVLDGRRVCPIPAPPALPKRGEA